MEVMMTSVKDISTHPGIDLLSRATIRGNHNTDLKLAQVDSVKALLTFTFYETSILAFGICGHPCWSSQ